MASRELKAKLALALDVPDLETARGWVERLAPSVGVFKVGLELFTAAGPDAVRMVHDAGAACFLDLKLHDIPATMERAVRAAARLRVRYLTVHAAAGKQALRAASDARGDIQLLAVTVLTSFDDASLADLGIETGAEQWTARLAAGAREAGVGGFVTSPLECARLRTLVGHEACLVTPGIRPQGTQHDDQQRIATPAAAIRAGANLLVVGRPIRNAEDPLATARAILAEVDEASK